MNSTLYRNASEEERNSRWDIFDALRVHSAFHPYWIVIKRSRASPGSLSCHSLVIRPLHLRTCMRTCLCLCVCACRRKKNKPPLIHVFPPSPTITWKRRGPKPGSTINQISPLPPEKNVPSFDFMKLLHFVPQRDQKRKGESWDSDSLRKSSLLSSLSWISRNHKKNRLDFTIMRKNHEDRR